MNLLSHKSISLLQAAAGLVLALLVCTVSAGHPAIDPPAAGTEMEPFIADAPLPVGTPILSDPSERCPAARAGTMQYINDEKGFCFLFPARFRPDPGLSAENDGITLIGPPFDSDAMEPVMVRVSLFFNGPDEGMSPHEYAERWAAYHFPAIPNLALPLPPIEDTLVGRHEAARANDAIAGLFGGDIYFMTANGYRYSLQIAPANGLFPDVQADWDLAWSTISGSLVYFPPGMPGEYTRSTEVCPTPTRDTILHVQERDGYCFLVPSDFERDERYSSGFVIGEPLPKSGPFGGTQARLVFSAAGPAVAGTPRERVEQFIDQIDASTIREMTIGGAPAVTYIDSRAPWPTRIAIVFAQGLEYTIVNQPYDEMDYGSYLADVERVWHTVTETLVFFTPWA